MTRPTAHSLPLLCACRVDSRCSVALAPNLVESQETLTDLFKYLAIARRSRGDMPGAKEALARVENLGGSKGREDVEGLDRLMAENKISVV